MQPAIKLISTDFDGTIFAEFDQPATPPSLLARLKALKADGVHWVINTGRDLSSLLESMARAGFDVRPDYLVIVEREIYRLEGQEYVEDKAWNDRCHAVHDELFLQVAPFIPDLLDWVDERFDATIYRDDYSPFCLLARSNKDADKITKKLAEVCAKVPGLTVVRNDVYARLSHQDYNKGKALAEVTRQLGLTASQVFACGDHLNDLPMLDLQYAKYLATPANGVPEVQELIRKQGGYISHQPVGFGTERALEYYLEIVAQQAQGR